MTEREWRQLDDRLNRLEAKLDKLFSIIGGNGKGGLLVEVDRHSRAISSLTRLFWLAAAAFASAAAVRVMDLIKGI